MSRGFERKFAGITGGWGSMEYFSKKISAGGDIQPGDKNKPPSFTLFPLNQRMLRDDLKYL